MCVPPHLLFLCVYVCNRFDYFKRDLQEYE